MNFCYNIPAADPRGQGTQDLQGAIGRVQNSGGRKTRPSTSQVLNCASPSAPTAGCCAFHPQVCNWSVDVPLDTHLKAYGAITTAQSTFIISLYDIPTDQTHTHTHTNTHTHTHTYTHKIKDSSRDSYYVIDVQWRAQGVMGWGTVGNKDGGYT